MKKFFKLRTIVALASVGLFFATGCKSEAEPEPAPALGVVGHINGVLYDSVTFLPLEGVEVHVAGIDKTVTSNADGTYKFDNVPIGDQKVTFTKDGYQFAVDTLIVRPRQYLDDDPYAEYEAFLMQLTALQLAAQQDGNGPVNLEDIKLIFTYTKYQTLNVSGLVPLRGQIAGTIKLVKAGHSTASSTTLTNADFVDIEDDVQLWLHYGNGALNAGAEIHGPYATANGGFSISNVPMETGYDLEFNDFWQDGFLYVYSAADNFKVWDGSAFNNAVIDPGYDKPMIYELYLFANDGIVTLESFAAGSVGAAVNPSGTDPAITLTFSEAIDPNTFGSTTFTAATPTNTVGAATVTLIPSWSADGKTVTLKPLSRWPYSINGLLKIGDVTLSNSIRAKSGSGLFNSSVSIPVFTTEAIKLDKVDIAPSNVTARVAVSAAAVQLTFTKPLSASSTFQWTGGTNGNAFWKFASADNTSVYVYTDELGTSTSGISYTAISAADAFDTRTGTMNEVLGAGIEKAAPTPLTLKVTSLWAVPLTKPITAQTEYEVGAPNTASTSPAITLTFDTAIPANAQLYGVTLEDQSNYTSIPVSVTSAGAVVTITPNVRLVAGRNYRINVSITDIVGNSLFSNNDLQIYNGKIANVVYNGISFTTKAPDTASVSGVYGATSGDSIYQSGNGITGNFVIGKEYYIIFNNDIEGTPASSYAAEWRYWDSDTSSYIDEVKGGLSFTVTKHGTKVLGFRLNADAAVQDEIASLNTNITVTLLNYDSSPGIGGLNTAYDITIQANNVILP